MLDSLVEVGPGIKANLKGARLLPFLGKESACQQLVAGIPGLHKTH